MLREYGVCGQARDSHNPVYKKFLNYFCLQPAKSSDDLLQLSGNPFASVLNSAAAPAPPAAPNVAPAAQSGGFNFGTGFPDTANANGTLKETFLNEEHFCSALSSIHL